MNTCRTMDMIDGLDEQRAAAAAETIMFPTRLTNTGNNDLPLQIAW